MDRRLRAAIASGAAASLLLAAPGLPCYEAAAAKIAWALLHLLFTVLQPQP